ATPPPPHPRRRRWGGGRGKHARADAAAADLRLVHDGGAHARPRGGRRVTRATATRSASMNSGNRGSRTPFPRMQVFQCSATATYWRRRGEQRVTHHVDTYSQCAPG